MATLDRVLDTLYAPREGKAVTPPSTSQGADAIFVKSSSSGRFDKGTARRHLQAYGGTDAIDHVMDCVELIAQTASNSDYHFEREGEILVPQKTDKTPEDFGEAPQDLTRLFRYPNPWQDWTEFVELTVIDFLLVGNSFWLKFRPTDQGKPLALYRLDPRDVTVVAGQRRMIDHYELDVGGDEPKKYKADEIVHFRRPNPHSDQVGLGFISGSPRMFDIELAMTESMANYYEQGMRLSGVLESDRTVPNPIMEKIKRQFAGLYAGARNSYQVPVLERGLKFRPVSSTAAEAEFKTLAPYSQERIAALFKVPLPLLGAYKNADRQAIREAQRIFDNKVMRPFLKRLQGKITQSLVSAWAVEFIFDYEYVMPIEDRLDLAESLATLPGIRVREIRDQVGLDALGPDEKMPDGTLIDDVVLNLPGDDENESKVKDRGIGSEPGRPPNPENTRPFGTDATPDDAEVVT